MSQQDSKLTRESPHYVDMRADPIYMDMSDNPHHLLVSYKDPLCPMLDLKDLSLSQGSNVDTISQRTNKNSCKATHTALLKCKHRLVFLAKAGEHCTIVQKLADENTLCLLGIWITDFLYNIEKSLVLSVRTKIELTDASQVLTKLKEIARTLDSIPITLQNIIPDKNRQEINDLILEDLYSINQYCYECMKDIRKLMHTYEQALQNLSGNRLTRQTELMLQGIEPISLELLGQVNDNEADHEHDLSLSKSLSLDQSQMDSMPTEASTSLVSNDTVALNMQLDNLSVSEEDQQRAADDPSLSTSTNKSLETIIEEQSLTDSDSEHLLGLIKEVVGEETFEANNIHDPVHALDVLQDKLGISLDLYESNLMAKVTTLCKSKRMFKELLTSHSDQTIEPSPNQDRQISTLPLLQMPPLASHLEPIPEISSSPSYSNTSGFDTPLTSFSHDIYTIYHTAQSKTPSNQVHESTTPSRNGIHAQRNIIDNLTNPDNPAANTIIGKAADSGPPMPPQAIGPDLNSQTTLDDLDRHQRALLHPPVRSKTLSKGLTLKDIDLSLIGTLNTEDQREYIGEHIYPFVVAMKPNHAKKITGMILELPKSELIPGIKSPHILTRMVNEAMCLLDAQFEEESSHGSGDNVSPMQEPKTRDTTVPPHNDHHSAMFQEVQHTPLSRNQTYMHEKSAPLYQSSAKMGSQVKTIYSTSAHQTPSLAHQVKVTDPLFINIPHGNNPHPVYSGPRVNEHQNSTQQDLYRNTLYSHNVLNPGNDRKVKQTSTSVGFAPFSPSIAQSQLAGASFQTNSPKIDDQFKQNKDDQAPYTQVFWTSHGQQNVHPMGYRYGGQPNMMRFNFPTHSGNNQSVYNPNPAMTMPSTHKPTQYNMQQPPITLRQPNPAVVELVLRERKELQSTSFLVQRTVNLLSMASHMNSEELTDILSNMKEYGRSLEKLEDKVSKFLRCLITNKDVIDGHDPALYACMKQEIDEAENLSANLQSKLNEADLIIGSERITLSQSHADSKDLSYKEFSAGRGMHDAHIYEFLNSLETNFRITRTPENLKSQTLKSKLIGSAKFAIPEDLNNYRHIVQILIQKFGNPIEILSHILKLHQEIGKIPSKYCQRPPWEKIEDVCKSHLLLIRKAEFLSRDPKAWPQIFENSFRNFHLINLISHEWNDDLKSIRDSIDAGQMYKMVVKRLEEILTSASSNIDHTEYKQSRDSHRDKKSDDKIDMDQFALAYGGEKRPREVTIGNCQPQDCHFCVTFQKCGRGKNYFEKHLLHGPTKRNYVNNCPNYLSITLTERNAFVFTNNFCQFCLRPKALCKNKACGDDHLIPYQNGKKKGYVCLDTLCRHRIELCTIHQDLNKDTNEARKQSLTERFNMDFTVSIFTAIPSPVCNDTQKDINDGNTENLIAKTTNYPSTTVDKTADGKIAQNLTENEDRSPHEPSNISREYETYKQIHHKEGSPVLFIPHDPPGVKGKTLPHKVINNLDQPLLVDSTNQLLTDKTTMLAGDCRSIFIYSKLQGLTRPLSTFFDSGGGSSLALNNVPGRQLPACKGNAGPMCLKGIGSGKTTGEQYTMLLPLLDGGQVAVEIYAVPEILQPMSRIDLEPALKFFKESCIEDTTLEDNIKDEIEKASIYRYIQGSIDLLLGVKLLGIFPKLIHTLSCGLSIFKMRLKPSSSATYCLGGPYQSLSSLQAMFPDGALMIQEMDVYLSEWRESAHEITSSHAILTNPEELTYEMRPSDHPSQMNFPSDQDNIIMALEETEVQDCDCGKPLMIGTELIICCTIRAKIMGKIKASFLNPIRDTSNKPYNKVDWLENINSIIMQYQGHITTCPVKHCDYSIKQYDETIAPCKMREEMGSLFAKYKTDFELSSSMQFLKHAMCHLDTCIQTNPDPLNLQRPNTFIAFQCNQSFKEELSTFQKFFLTIYPDFKDCLIPAESAHITLLAFRLPSDDHLQEAGIAFGTAWNKWLASNTFKNSMSMSFKGAGMFDDNLLYLKPTYYKEALDSLNSILKEEFKQHGFVCDERFTPHVSFARIKPGADKVFPVEITKTFSQVEVGSTRFHRIEMLSMKKPKGKEYPCLKALNFAIDHTLPNPCPDVKPCINDKLTKNTASDTSDSCSKILAFHPAEDNEEQYMQQVVINNPSSSLTKYNEAWNNLLDAFKCSGIYNNDLKYRGQRASSTNTIQHDHSSPEKDNEDMSGYILTEVDCTHFIEPDVFQPEMVKEKVKESNANHEKVNSKQQTNSKDLIRQLEHIFKDSDPEPRCSNCADCKSCKDLLLAHSNNIESTQHEEEFIIKSLIKFDKKKGKFCVELPLKKDPNLSLASNAFQSKKIYNRITKNLDKNPEDKLSAIKSFNTQVELGFIQRLASLDPSLQKSILEKEIYVIPWNVVHKTTSISTPTRIVLNASSKTKTGKSLNDILCKGIPKVDIFPLVMILLADPILLTLDLQKFYNSCIIPESQYHLQCIWWQEHLDTKKEPELYVIKTHTYGVVSSGRILELCLEEVANLHSEHKDFYDLFKRKVYVDDGFANCKTLLHAEKLKKDCERILPKMGFKAKGYAESYCVPPPEISDEIDGRRTVGTIGMIWIPESDILMFRPPCLDFTGILHRGKLLFPNPFCGNTIQELDLFVPKHLTLRMVASKTGKFWDPAGLAEAWFLGIKHILRLSTQAVSRNWDDSLPSDLRDLWVTKFWEMIKISRIAYPRCTFPLGVNYTELIILGLSDMGLIGKLQCFYSLKKISDENYHVQLIYSKSRLADNKSVPCQELDSLNTSSNILDKICESLGNVDRKALLMDSTICAYWLMKSPVKLSTFQRLRVLNILRKCDKRNIFHIRSTWNSSDVGTKRPEPITAVLPGSFFSTGPKILQLGLDGCEQRSLIKQISNVVLDPAIQRVALDGLANKNMPPEYLESESTQKPTSILKWASEGMTHPLECFPSESIDISIGEKLITTQTDDAEICTFNKNSIEQLNSHQREDLSPTDNDELIMVHNPTFVKKVQERFDFHEYLLNPIEKPWSVTIRTMSIVFQFIKRILLRKLNTDKSIRLSTWKRAYINLFRTESEPLLSDCFTNLCFVVKEDKYTYYPYEQQYYDPYENMYLNTQNQTVLTYNQVPVKKIYGREAYTTCQFCDTQDHTSSYCPKNPDPNPIYDPCEEIFLPELKIKHKKIKYADMFPNIRCLKLAKESAIIYYMRLASAELKQFYSKTMLKKHAFLIDGIYYSKQRLLEEDNITNLMGDELTTHEMGIQNRLPCSDRYSPVAISILIHFHRKVSNHQGIDRSWMATLSSMYIFQGQQILKEIVKGCFHCRYKLKQRFKTSYGPINKMSLTFTAVNQHVMLDLSGPYMLKSRLNARQTRANSGKEKFYCLHTVCLTSFINTIVLVEDYSSQAFTDALHRIGTRYGYPSVAYTDASRSQLQSLLGTELTMSSILGPVYKETGIEIKISGAGSQSHSRNGRVEKAIHLFQLYLENKRVEIEDLTVLQFESIISQAAAFLNSMPLCHKKRVDASISSTLVSPFSFLLGRRSNSRAPASHPILSNSRGDILDGVARASEGMLNYFMAAIPDLLLKPSNHDESDTMIMIGDIVLFPHKDNEISKSYKLGLVTDLEYDSDQKSRIVELAYANSQEQSLPLNHSDRVKLKTCCRFTRRGVHTLTKIYSACDPDINKDIDHINEQIKCNSHLGQENMKIMKSNSMDEYPEDEEIDLLAPDISFALVMSQMGYLVRDK